MANESGAFSSQAIETQLECSLCGEKCIALMAFDVSTCQVRITVPRIPFLICFHLGWATGDNNLSQELDDRKEAEAIW